MLHNNFLDENGICDISKQGWLKRIKMYAAIESLAAGLAGSEALPIYFPQFNRTKLTTHGTAFFAGAFAGFQTGPYFFRVYRNVYLTFPVEFISVFCHE